MCLIKAGRAITEGFLIHSTLNSSSMHMVEREKGLLNFYVQKEILLGAFFPRSFDKWSFKPKEEVSQTESR